jgi:DNA-binding HxlR family transcriptional regulator
MSTLAASKLKSAPDIARFFHFRWSPPALDVLATAGGAKLVTIAARVGAERKSVRRAMDALVESALARRNIGHGHPMRPEYLPTPLGKRVAAAWSAVDLGLRRLGAEEVAQAKWPVPVLVLMAAGAERFGEMLDACDGLTPRALAHALRVLVERQLAERRLRDGFPPWVSYRLAATGLLPELTALIHAFAR